MLNKLIIAIAIVIAIAILKFQKITKDLFTNIATFFRMKLGSKEILIF